MSIVADFYDLSPAEFLLMLSLNRKTGKLTAVNEASKVLIAFREGSIVYAASTSVRERLGSILVGRNLVSEETIHRALEIHKSENNARHLGNILVEMGAIAQHEIDKVVGEQFQRVVSDLLSWNEGMITFSRIEIPDLGAVHVNPQEMLTDMGFETEQLVLGSMSELEDSQKSEAENDQTRAIEPPLSDDARNLMKSMMDEMQSLAFSLTAEVTLEILGGAAEVVERAILLIVAPESISGSGGFGVDVEGLSTDVIVRNCVIPRVSDSIFARVIETRRTYFGPLEYNATHGLFIDQLGGSMPEMVIAVPLVYQGQVAAILYGDNAPVNTPITSPDRLDALMNHIGTALEAV